MAPSLVKKMQIFGYNPLSCHIFLSEYATISVFSPWRSVARAVLAREELLKLLQYVRSYNCFGITSVLNDTVYVQEIFRVTYTRCVNKFVQTGIDFRYAGDWIV